MYIANAYYKAIPVTGATFPLAAGTIVTANGTVPASAEQYFGIVPEKVDKMPTTGYIFVAVSGTIDLDTCGVTFTDAQIKALGADFNFVRAKEEHEPPAPELPTVSAVDNGKVLTVVNGAWAAASGGGGGGGLVVNVTWDEDETTATLDKNYNEIRTALSSGIPVLGITLYEAEGDEEIDCYYVGHTTASEIGYKVTMRDAGATSFGEIEFVASTPTGTLTYTAGT